MYRVHVLRQSILKIAEIGFVRSAIEEQVDLSVFKDKPTPKVLAGLFAMGFSYIIGWPAIALLGIVSVNLREPLLVVIGGPLLYGLSHLVFILGMYLAGAVYSVIFLRWLTRVSMERLLAWAKIRT